MSTSDSGMSDDVQVRTFSDADGDDMNAAEDAREQTEQPATLPDRPADDADDEEWVDYCVALGADRTYLTEETRHEDFGGTLIEPALTRDQLIELADRLGG